MCEARDRSGPISARVTDGAECIHLKTWESPIALRLARRELDFVVRFRTLPGWIRADVDTYSDMNLWIRI